MPSVVETDRLELRFVQYLKEFYGVSICFLTYAITRQVSGLLLFAIRLLLNRISETAKILLLFET